ncbi:MAG: carboxypeptidase regulatory-like domain-containing protein [Gemmatimonadota bacterium]
MPQRFPAVLAAGILLLCAGPAAGQGRTVTVTGTVVEPSQSARIGGATVRLSGHPFVITGVDGAFRFTGVAPGRHTLTVEAFGYRPGSLELVVRGDTTLVIEMTPDPIRLDSIRVEARDVRIRGDIFDARTNKRVLMAQVTISPGFPTRGALSGRFSIGGVPAGRAVSVLVEAIEYLPARVALITERDTTLTVRLEPDSVGIRLVRAQVQKLEVRSEAVSLSRRTIERETLEQTPDWDVKDILKTRFLGHDPSGPCIFIDDVKRNADFLLGLLSGEVERIEVFGRGAMIRVYTKRFVARLMGKDAPLPTIIYMRTVLGPVCR